MLLRSFIAPLPQAPLLWLLLAMSSTFAGNLTILGSVANLIVAQRSKGECPLSFAAFLRVGVPSTLLTTLAGACLLWLYHLAPWV
jgi:Na+/H+ antiporter NhaD/arsenite permease-like protein